MALGPPKTVLCRSQAPVSKAAYDLKSFVHPALVSQAKEFWQVYTQSVLKKDRQAHSECGGRDSLRGSGVVLEVAGACYYEKHLFWSLSTT